MGRPRSFDTIAVVVAAADAFRLLGYQGTSVDDLLAATGLQRGSLYGAFGSKRGIFLAALQHLVDIELPDTLAAPSWREDLVTDARLDLLLIAALELAPRDDTVRDLLDSACTAVAAAAPGDDRLELAAALMGRRLLHRARVPVHPADNRQEGARR